MVARRIFYAFYKGNSVLKFCLKYSCSEEPKQLYDFKGVHAYRRGDRAKISWMHKVVLSNTLWSIGSSNSFPFNPLARRHPISLALKTCTK
jgi:hypothetical protein